LKNTAAALYIHKENAYQISVQKQLYNEFVLEASGHAECLFLMGLYHGDSSPLMRAGCSSLPATLLHQRLGVYIARPRRQRLVH
jgi:hypothetical protein